MVSIIGLITGATGITLLAIIALVVLGHPLYIALGALVLRACGDSKVAVAKWALKQDGRNRMIEVIRAMSHKFNKI